MINQFVYFNNRTPFLDIDFMKAIFKTRLSGIHSGFFEHNPMKRYKGQVLYAHIINKAYPLFGRLVTDKGYRPNDLLNQFGKFNIIKGYITKKAARKTPCFDPYGVANAFGTNYHFWKNIPMSSYFFNLEEVKRIELEKNRDLLYKIISLSYIMQQTHALS